MTSPSEASRWQVWRREIPPLRAWRRIALGAVMVAVMAAELSFLFTAAPTARTMAHAGLPVLLLLAAPTVGMREAYLLAIALVLGALTLWLDAAAAATFARALDQAAFLATFILSIGLLREAAATSPAVLACGIYTTRQPSGRRYIAVTLGGNLIGALINLGALSLLAPLIQRGVREDAAKGASHYVVARVRERRQLTALSRGFAFAIAWAPTTVTLAILPTVIPGIHLHELVAAGLGLATVMLGVGWLEDRIRFAPLRRLLASRGWLPELEPAPFPSRAFAGLGLVCASLIVLTAGLRFLSDVATVPALMLAAPAVLVGWVAAQYQGSGARAAAAATGQRLSQIAGQALPRSGPEAVTLGTSGFIAILAAALVPLDLVTEGLRQAALPQWLFLLGLPVTMLAVGQLGPSPVFMVILLGTLLGALPALPAGPTLTAIALATGGALATAASPFASGVLVLSRVTGHSTTAIAWRWNMPFVLAGVLVLAVLFPLLTGGR